MKRGNYLWLAGVLALLISGALLFSNSNDSRKNYSRTQISLEQYAENILEICKNKNFRPACYDEEIPKLMDKISMEDAFRVTGIIQSLDSAYPYCHVLAHRLAAKEINKDPSKWKSVATRAPIGMCSNGGIHGAFQERFRKESLTPEEVKKIKPELMDLCEKRPGWNPSNLDKGACYHALGHLLMYLTGADIKASLKLCDEIGIKPDSEEVQQTCYDGAFMQIFQPLEPEDFDLLSGKEIKPGELTDFCGSFGGKQRSSCWSEGWPLVRQDIMTPEGLVEYCSNDILQDQDSKDRCLISVSYAIIVQMKFNMDSFKKFCSLLPESVSDKCFSAGATRLISTDYKNASQATAFCASIDIERDRDVCYSKLLEYALYSFYPGSEESTTLCDSLPKDWKAKCAPNSQSSPQLEVCLDAAEKLTCWRNFLNKVLEEKGLGAAFDVLAKLYDTEPVFASECHSYTHELGEKAYAIFSKNGNLEMTPKASYCGYGFYHGFVETLLHSEGSIKQAQEFCSLADKQLSSYGKKTSLACYHGIGHGAVDGGDPRSWGSPQKLINPGLQICKAVSGSQIQLHQCGTGVFNALAIALNSNKFGLYFTDDPYKFCLDQDEDFKKACYSQMNTRAVYLSERNFGRAVKFVLNIPEKEYAVYSMEQLAPAAINDRVGQNQDFQNEIKVCRSLPSHLKMPCLEGLAGGIMEFGKPDYEYAEAMDFCRSLGADEPEKKTCYGHIVSHSKLLYSQEKAQEICRLVDSKYRAQCD